MEGKETYRVKEAGIEGEEVKVQTTLLNGAGSFDPGSVPYVLLWSLLSAPAGSNLSNTLATKSATGG